MTTLFPSFFVSHGGGPCFWMDWNPPELFHGLRRFFEGLPERLPHRPTAIVAISAHWEESRFTLQSTAQPGMIYDYSGFPAHTYQLNYPAQGSPELAQRISNILAARGIAHAMNSARGYDHGVFVPLLIAFPEADIPVMQISLRSDLSPAAHLELGKALEGLRQDGVLVLGSGFSYHNLRGVPDRTGVSEVFDRWLHESLCEVEPEQRHDRLLLWTDAPAARAAHPREEHLIPLMVCAGAASSGTCTRVYSEKLPGWNIQTSCFQFD